MSRVSKCVPFNKGDEVTDEIKTAVNEPVTPTEEKKDSPAQAFAMDFVTAVKDSFNAKLAVVAVVLGILTMNGLSGSGAYNTLLLIAPALAGYVLAKALVTEKYQTQMKILAITALLMFLFSSYQYGSALATFAGLRNGLANISSSMNSYPTVRY